MNIRQAIQASANVVRVTNIVSGDVYKRFDTSDDRMFFGIVNNVHNDGENTIVQATEYCYRYGTLDISLKNLRGTSDYTIFPATPEELNLELGGIAEKKQREIDQKRNDIAKLEREIVEVNRLLSGEATKDLRAMSYTELSQEQYNAKKLAAAM